MRESRCSFISSYFKLQNPSFEIKLFSNLDMATKRIFNVHEALKYLENLEVFDESNLFQKVD